ncbi:MAG TPA: LuxR C-terminal-related transcriptional regulator, partial [Stellaceae bacterium]|nr:LuxR C-terminal-related transcriptional regulator [Stellaceae bacterium]
MTSIALYASDPAARRQLEALVGEQRALHVVGAAESREALARLLGGLQIDAVLAASPPGEAAAGTACVVIVEDATEESALEALSQGAHAVLSLSAGRAEIAAAIAAAVQGYATLPQVLLTRLLVIERPEMLTAEGEDAPVQLTAREVEVLSALADGASNKAIARRLGISFHTVKFHVASILTKL